MKTLLNCSRIWSNIHIHGQDFNRLDAQIKRCRRAPLLVSVESRPNATEPSRRDELLKNIHEATEVIRKRRDQVTFLRVLMACEQFHWLLGCDWPSLEEFVLIDSCPFGSKFHEDRYADSACGCLPKLKVLFVQGSPNWPIDVATNLTAFKLRGTVDFKLETLTKFFRRNTSLETLELIDLNVWRPSSGHGEQLIELPHLKTLSVRDGTCGSALAVLCLPSLKRLRVSSNGGQDPWKGSPWSEFCRGLPITNLEAHYRSSSSHDGISVIGWSNGMDTESLCFSEFNLLDVLGITLFGSLSNASLSSVTYLSLIKDMPEKLMSSSLVATTCDLLKYLPRVERMRLRPSPLVVGVVRRLGGDSKLCPGLRELAMRVTEKACKMVLDLVAEMKARVDCGDRRKMIRVILLQSREAGARAV